MDILIGLIILLLYNAYLCRGRDAMVRLTNIFSEAYVGAIALNMFGAININWFLLAFSFPVILIAMGLLYHPTKE